MRRVSYEIGVVYPRSGAGVHPPVYRQKERYATSLNRRGAIFGRSSYNAVGAPQTEHEGRSEG